MPLDGAFGLPPLKKGEMERLLEAGKANEPLSITQPLSGWCRDYNIPVKIAEQRIAFGMTIEQALTATQADTLQLRGEQVSLSDLCMRLGLDFGVVNRRISEGMSVLEAINDAAYRKIDGRVPVDGDALKIAREKAGLSQSRLAELVNQRGPFKFTKYVIHGLEHGKRLALPIEKEVLEAVLVHHY